MIFDQTARSREVQVGQSRVVVAAGRDQHVVDRPRQLSEERSRRPESVASKAAVLRASTSAAARSRRSGSRPDEDDVGALAAGASSGFETDAGAAADQDNGLAEQLRFAEG